MTNKKKILIAFVFAIAIGLLCFLVFLGRIGAESLLGLLGIIIGALMSEFSHNESSREDRKNQLRLAALDRRLQAHQEAYSLWHRLMKDMGDQLQLSQTVQDCQSWWIKNCLYLTADARQAFSHAYTVANTYYVNYGNEEVKLYETQVILGAGSKIVQGVELPIIHEIDDKGT